MWGTPSLALALAGLCLQTLAQPLPDATAEPPGPYDGDSAIDLLEALTASRAIPGVSPAPGPTPGTPAWRFGRRTPHLTLPRAYAVFVLASAPRALGFHAVARQSPRSQGTLLALLSPTARSPLLHLASSARGDELRLDYRAAPSGHPASLVFPGGSPFAGGRWVRLALSLAPHRLALYADCRPAVVLGQAGHRPRLSLHLPLDLQIAFASLPGDADSKFLGTWQTAEISTTGFSRRPWHCDHLEDPVLLPWEPEPEAEPEPGAPGPMPLSEPPPPGPGDVRSDQQAPEELAGRVRRLEGLLQELGSRLNALQLQNSELLARVRELEACACLGCHCEGQHHRHGDTGAKDACAACPCPRPPSPQPPQAGTLLCAPGACARLDCTAQEGTPGACCPQSQAPVTVPPNSGCQDGATRREHGEEWAPLADPCQICRCTEGRVLCVQRQCARLCPHPASPRPGTCCPVCDGCSFEGRDYASGEPVPSAEPCTQCVCTAGEVSCQRLEPSCPPAPCSHPAHTPAQCCPTCHGCEFEGSVYQDGERFIPRGAGRCLHCTCSAGSVQCLPSLCPPVPCLHPQTLPGHCCPMCPGHGELPAGGVLAGIPPPRLALFPPMGRGAQAGSPPTCIPAPPGGLFPGGHSRAVPMPSPCPPGCSYHGVTATHGQSFADPEDAQCSQCTCQAGSVQCQRKPCPPASCPHPAPGACNCPLCQGCHFQGQDLADGETFAAPQDPCEQCQCQEGAVLCARVSCPPLTCTHPVTEPGVCCPHCQEPPRNCTASLVGSELQPPKDPCYSCRCQDLKWVCVHEECRPPSCPPAERFTPQGACCPICHGCILEADGRHVPDGETWTDDADACVTCTCSLGHVQCHVEECTDLACPDGLERVQVPGTCCGQCQAVSPVPGSTCSYQGRRFESHERWQVDACTACSCVAGEVHCRSQRCPPPACGPDEAPALTPGRCCPHCHPRPATCQAFGDPHYRTFDGRLLHFQGTCTYVLVRDCHAEDFSVHVSNDARGHTGVSWTQEVAVQVGGTWVQLLQGGEVTVDGEAVTLPFLKEPAVYVERRSGTVLLNTHVGLQVQWDGRSHVELSVPGTYRGRTCGLCGNFNGFAQDDLRGPGGDLLPSHAALGNSWQAGAARGLLRCLRVRCLRLPRRRWRLPLRRPRSLCRRVPPRRTGAALALANPLRRGVPPRPGLRVHRVRPPVPAHLLQRWSGAGRPLHRTLRARLPVPGRAPGARGPLRAPPRLPPCAAPQRLSPHAWVSHPRAQCSHVYGGRRLRNKPGVTWAPAVRLLFLGGLGQLLPTLPAHRALPFGSSGGETEAQVGGQPRVGTQVS
ncbi:kielin/chordin-like protein isoform X3 [Alligator mississippiensis]|uniref:kielin/chordin-like protein isoform X3 n=1 Tax=Alligator mississippiensis TaxID=8496 RepID=UPI002877A9D4|nr:kielin/chordin-like protein isoform X3 [Alligator mississippiensis]